MLDSNSLISFSKSNFNNLSLITLNTQKKYKHSQNNEKECSLAMFVIDPLAILRLDIKIFVCDVFLALSNLKYKR